MEEGVGSFFFFSFHIWICFNAFIQMHLRYCPTVTSQFTIKIRFCFLPSLSFPTFLAWVECSVGKAVCMQIRATQGELSHGSAATGTLCSPPGGGKKGLYCQQYEIIFVLQINHSLTSDRPIVHLLSSVGVVVVHRQLEMCQVVTIVGYRTINGRCLLPCSELTWWPCVRSSKGRYSFIQTRESKRHRNADNWSLPDDSSSIILCVLCSSVLINSNWWATCYGVGLHPCTRCVALC